MPDQRAVESTSTAQDRGRDTFLRYAIDYIEARIRSVDTKANILIVVQGGLSGLLLSSLSEGSGALARCFAVLHVLFACSAVFLLVRTVRPTVWFLWPWFAPDVRTSAENLLWFGEEGPGTLDDQRHRIGRVTSTGLSDALVRTHWVVLKLAHRKYRFYRWAVVALTVSLLSGIVAFLLDWLPGQIERCSPWLWSAFAAKEGVRLSPLVPQVAMLVLWVGTIWLVNRIFWGPRR